LPKTTEITNISQIHTEAFLRDVKGFNPLNDGECLITDFPVKVQSYAGYDTHAAVFKDGEEFSEWINKNAGAKTRAIGDTVFWDSLSDEAKIKMNRYYFFHHEDHIDCPNHNARVKRVS
jgi:hypothetical protein